MKYPLFQLEQQQYALLCKDNFSEYKPNIEQNPVIL